MSKAKQITTPDYTAENQNLQNANSTSTPEYSELVTLLNDVFLMKRKILNTCKKITGNERGKMFVQMIPYLDLKDPTYEQLGECAGVSHEQARQWVEKFAPEIFREKQRGGVR